MSLATAAIDRPLRITADPAMSLEEFWRFSAENRDLRMEREPNGDVVLMSPTLGGAGARSMYIAGKLFAWNEESGTGTALDSSTGCQLPDGSTRSADAAWIGKARWTPPSIENDSAVPHPDFVVELRSKSDRLQPLQEKMQMWVGNGCQLGWLIDAQRKVVEIYRPSQEPESQEGRMAVHGEGPLAGFVLELGRIWS